MFQIRKSSERGYAQHGWLESYHSFSFSSYYDPKHMGFGPLRVINEDWVQPQTGFGTHGHRDMEIITYMLGGELSHRDSLGGGSAIKPNQIQRMSAGTGIRHSEMNAHKTDVAHLLQIWIEPAVTGVEPGYKDHDLDVASITGQLGLVVTGDKAEAETNNIALIHQDAKMYAGRLSNQSVHRELDPARKGYLHVATGSVTVGDVLLQTGDALLGGAALFLLALGMGLPLVLFAAGAGAALPKAGAWMTWVSAAFGFVLLAVAVWTITPVTPVWIIMAAWAVLACTAAAALFHGATSMVTMGSRAKVLSKALGLLLTLLALIYLMGLFSGSNNLLQPLAGAGSQTPGLPRSASAGVSSSKPEFEKVKSEAALALIDSSTMPVMLDFYADWCVSCKEFELFTLTDAAVKAKLDGIRLVQVDVTDNTESDQLLLKEFQLFGPPAILFFPAGETGAIHQVIGFQNAQRFVRTDLLFCNDRIEVLHYL